jgi:2'-5' RNA ligase
MQPQYALVAYVGGALGEFVESLRRELHPAHAHLPAHLSILPPRQLQGSQNEAVDLIEQVCSQVAPFQVTMGDVESFIPVTPTVFLRVAHAAYRMRELHDRLNNSVLCAKEQWPYMPHLTIFRMSQLKQAQAALAPAIRRWGEYSGTRQFLLDELTFVREIGENRWVDIAPVRLGQRLASLR